MTKFSFITFQITDGDRQHYEYSFYELKNRAGVSTKEVVEDFIGSEVEVDKNDEHLFWFNDCRTIEIYGIDPITYVEIGVFKKFGVL